MKTFFKQIGLLLVCVGVALVALSLILSLFTLVAMKMGAGAVAAMHITLWAQNLFLMVAVPLLWARVQCRNEYGKESLSWGEVCQYLRLGRVDWRFMLMTFCLMIVITPASEMLDWASLKFPWPDSVREQCEASFINVQKIYMAVTSVEGVGGIIELFLLMCLSTAVGEEMIFRGALLNCFVRGGKFNWIASIWIVGFIFSIVHFDMMGFVSRFIMGAMLAYLVYWSRSLWPSILAHCINNTMALISFKTSTEEELLAFDRDLSFSPIIIALSLLSSALLLWKMWKMRVKTENF